MPLSIPLRHIKRMFPFEFYDEFYTAYPYMKPLLPSYKNHKATKEEFEKDLISTLNQQENMAKNNIFELDFEFPLLSIQTMTDMNSPINITPKAYILMVQYFDIDGNPVFTKEMPLDIIRKIPELLFDDPNLFIAAFDYSSGQLQIIKIPDVVKDLF